MTRVCFYVGSNRTRSDGYTAGSCSPTNLIIQKSSKKNIAGMRPAILHYGAAPLPSTQVDGKCLVAVVLDNQGRTLRLFTIQKEEDLLLDFCTFFFLEWALTFFVSTIHQVI